MLEEDRRRLGALLEVGTGHVAPVRQPRRHREAVARVTDGALQAAPQRQAAEGGVRFRPARHRARHGERGGQGALVRDFAQAAFRERLDRAARRGAPAALDVAHLARGGVVDQPEGIAADAGHVRIDDGQHRTRRH